jgi:hypothetical protein
MKIPTTSTASTIDSQTLMPNPQRKMANGIIPASNCRTMAPIELFIGGTLPIAGRDNQRDPVPRRPDRSAQRGFAERLGEYRDNLPDELPAAGSALLAYAVIRFDLPVVSPGAP